VSTMDNRTAGPPEGAAVTKPRDVREGQAKLSIHDIAEALIHVSSLALREDLNDGLCVEHRSRASLALRRAAWRLLYATERGFVEAEERWCQVDRGEAELVPKRDLDELRERARLTPADDFIDKRVDPCLAKREEGEPMFILLGRDTVAPAILSEWCHRREMEILAGQRADTEEERTHVAEVRAKVREFVTWRAANR
jgi:hypothetical protein